MEHTDDTLRNHLDLIYGTCRRMLGNDQDAADATQEVVVKWLQSRDCIRGSIAGWLHAAARTTAVDLIRRREAQRRAESHVPSRRSTTEEAQDSAEESSTELREHLDAALSELPQDERVLLIEYHLEGCGQMVLAERRQISQAHISRRLAKARDLLAAALNRRGIAVTGMGLLSFLASEAEAAPCPPALVIKVAAQVPVAVLPTAAAAMVWKGWLTVVALCLVGVIFFVTIAVVCQSPERIAGTGKPAELQAMIAKAPAVAGEVSRPSQALQDEGIVFLRDFDSIQDGEQTPNELVRLSESDGIVTAIVSKPYMTQSDVWKPDVFIKLLSDKPAGLNALYRVPEGVEVRIRMKSERVGTWGISQMPTGPDFSSENSFAAGLDIGPEWHEFVLHAQDMKPYMTESRSRPFEAGLAIQDIGIYGFGTGNLWIDRIVVSSPRPLFNEKIKE